LEEQDFEDIMDGIKQACGGDARTVRSNLNNFIYYRIIKGVSPKGQDIQQANKDLEEDLKKEGIRLRTLDEILGGPIEKKFEKKYH
jgi:hypothetical protein